MNNRIYITVAIEPRKQGGVTALVADHGSDIPSMDNPDIRVAKISDSSVEKAVFLTGAVIISAMKRAGFDLGEKDANPEAGPVGPGGPDGSWN